MSESSTKIIKHTITHLLSRREQSLSELRSKLELKGFVASEYESVLQLFVEAGLQSDQRFAESVVRSAYRKGKGVNYVKHHLKGHKLEVAGLNALIAEVSAEYDFDWFELALQIKQRKYGESPAADWAAKQKQSRFLQSRGFELDQIKYAMQ